MANRPMPAEIRAAVRAPQHPARAVPCPHPHCGAHEHQPCTALRGRRRLPLPHPSRIAAWAVGAGCAACGAPAGQPCRDGDGVPLRDDVHGQRADAARTAA